MCDQQGALLSPVPHPASLLASCHGVRSSPPPAPPPSLSALEQAKHGLNPPETVSYHLSPCGVVDAGAGSREGKVTKTGSLGQQNPNPNPNPKVTVCGDRAFEDGSPGP